MPSKKPAKKKKKHDEHSHGPLKFPRGFLWGAATSAHQVEGGNIHNDWWLWEQKKGNVKNNDQSGKATDHYNRYEEDFDWAKSLDHNAHRLSIEWSRIEPEEGKWNFDEVAHYRNVLKALRKRKLKAMLTLHHFTNPAWIAKQGGWNNSDTPRYFARYATFIAEHLGEYVDFWVTINEPIIYIGQGYGMADWPPQRKSFFAAAGAFLRLSKGHQLAYKAIHAQLDEKGRKKKRKKIVQVGIAKNQLSITMYRNRFIDYLYVRVSEFVWNDLFFLWTRLKYFDFIGVNYYFHQRVKRAKGRGFIYVDVRSEEKRESSDLGWEVFAPGLFNVLMDLRKYKKPMYVTENGISTTNDDKRVRYIVVHLKELYHALEAGLDVKGYFHWSLLDNFEWSQGFTPRFGLIEVNYKTFKRTPRPSAFIYSQICRDNEIDHELLRFLGHGVKVGDVCKDCKVKIDGLS